MIAMERGVGFGFGVLAGRVLGIVAVGGGWLLSAGAGAGMAQVTSSLTFRYNPNFTTTTVADTNDLAAAGTVPYLGNGVPAFPSGNEFFSGITGIQFVNQLDPAIPPQLPNPTFNYTTDQGVTTINNFALFYFIGDTVKESPTYCSICGTATAPPPPSSFIQVPVTTNASVALTPDFPSQDITNVNVSGGPIGINFGDSGQTGTITFSASNFVALNTITGNGSGAISFNVNQSTAKVPGPLPILGASTAFAFSRKLRRRIVSKTVSATTIKSVA